MKFVSHEVAGVGGVIKQRPEDFLVDEQPLYQPAGTGEHIYLLVQKRMMSTMQMLGIVARHFGVPRKHVGFAGLKDKLAITRQVVSVHVPGRKLEDFPMLQHEQLAILWADYHTNKLRPGHLRGNRFSIRIRGVEPMRVRDALRTLRILQAEGVPNRFGTQRFGMLGNNHLIGQGLIRQDYAFAIEQLLGKNAQRPDFNAQGRELFAQGRYHDAIFAYPREATIETRVLRALADGKDHRKALLSLDDTSLRFYLSAFQSAVFNRVLEARLDAGSFATLAPGDIAIKHENGAVFGVDESVAASPDTVQRLASFAISPSGPMWGASMARAGGQVDAIELAALRAEGVTLEQLAAFDQGGRLALEGKRRALRVPIIDPEVEGGLDEHGPFVRCAFELPRGSFATEVMREVIKPSSQQDGPGGIDTEPEDGA